MQDRILNPGTDLRYDGMMLGLHQFTELDATRPSYGATFYTKSRKPELVSLRREEKRVAFASGKRAS
jgi:hypothetical protein